MTEVEIIKHASREISLFIIHFCASHRRTALTSHFCTRTPTVSGEDAFVTRISPLNFHRRGQECVGDRRASVAVCRLVNRCSQMKHEVYFTLIPKYEAKIHLKTGRAYVTPNAFGHLRVRLMNESQSLAAGETTLHHKCFWRGSTACDLWSTVVG